jgi:hypothetical protein
MTEPLLNTPTLWINEYLKSKLSNLIQTPDGARLGVPFFPSKPATIDELTESFIIVDNQQAQYSGVMAVWDRLIRMNRKPFPHIKQEQMLYYFYATQDNVTETMVQVQEAVLRLLDRLDESAEDVNNWAKGKQINVGTLSSPVLISSKFYFHDFKVYQLEEVRDIIDFGTARTYGGNKIIIDYSYHQMPDLTYASEAP